MSSSAGKKFNINTIHILIILFFMFGFRFIPPIGSLTEISMQVIGVFVGVIYGWITVGITWPSVLGLVALGLTDYIAMSDLLVSAFGSQTIIMIFGLFMLAAFVQQADLTGIIVDFLLSRKSAKGRPFLILFYFLLAGFIAAILSQCLAVLVIFLGLFKEIMRKTGMEPYSKAVPTFFVGMAYALVIGDIALPFKGCAILGIGAYESLTGETMNLMSYTVFMLPMCIFTIAAYVLFCKYIVRVDLSCLANYEHVADETEPVTFRKKVSLIGMILCMVLLLVPSILPDSWAISGLVNNMGLGGLTLFLLAIMMLITIDGEPLLDVGKIAAYFPWGVYFVIVALFPLADALSSDAVGLKQLLSSTFSSFIPSLPSVAIIFAVVLLSALVTNFANNMVICSLFVTIICFMGDALPFSPVVLSCLVILGSNMSMFFPAANPMNAILFAQKDIVTFKQEVVHGLAACLFLCIITSIVGYLYGILVF